MKEAKYNYSIYSLLIIYIGMCCYKLSNPGVQYDELLFVNAATYYRFDSNFVLVDWKGFPILLMAYIGALKSYLYFPIITTFGVSIYTLRIPVILITAISLFTITKISNKYFFKEFSLLVLLFLVLDPSLIFITKLDVGPNVLELFTKCMACLFLYLFFIENRNLKYLIWGCVFLALGLFNKLNFIWFINALYGTMFLFQFNKIRKLILSKDYKSLKPFIILTLAYLVFYVYFIYIYFSFNLHNEEAKNFVSLFQIRYNQVLSLLDGTSFLKYLYDIKSRSINQAFYILCFVIFLLGFVLNLTLLNNKFILKYKRAYYFIMILLLLETIQFFLTKQANAPWHAFSLYPLFALLLAYSIYTIANVFINSKILSNSIVIGCATIITGYHIIVVNDYFKLLGTPPKNIHWSEKIYDLIRFTKQNEGYYISMDWGIHNQLMAFNPNNKNFVEIFPIFTQDQSLDTKKWLKETFFSKEITIYIITHPKEDQLNQAIFSNFLKFAQEMNLEILPYKIIGELNRDIFIIYKVNVKK